MGGMNLSLCLFSPRPGLNSRPWESISRDFSLTDCALPPHPEPTWQKMAQFPINGITQLVDIEEEGLHPPDNGWEKTYWLFWRWGLCGTVCCRCCLSLFSLGCDFLTRNCCVRVFRGCLWRGCCLLTRNGSRCTLSFRWCHWLGCCHLTWSGNLCWHYCNNVIHYLHIARRRLW